MSLHLIAEDPTPDEPTVPEPSVCPTCKGDRVILWRGTMGGFGAGVYPCPDCCCSTCGQPTETPPICRDCEERS